MEISAEEYARLKSLEKTKGLSLKVSKKGAVQLDGLRRFPVTFYKEEWKTIFAQEALVMAFISSHDSELASKKGDE